MSKMTVAIEKIQADLSKISDCGGTMENFVAGFADTLHAVVKMNLAEDEDKAADQENIVNVARNIAVAAHKGQMDKAGHDYMEHVSAVADAVYYPLEKATAYLHDVVEDTDIKLDNLKAYNLPEPVIEAVDVLTHRKNIPYMDYIRKVGENSIATAVKLADLKNNMDMSRLPCVTDKDVEREHKYAKAFCYLSNIKR